MQEGAHIPNYLTTSKSWKAASVAFLQSSIAATQLSLQLVSLPGLLPVHLSWRIFFIDHSSYWDSTTKSGAFMYLATLLVLQHYIWSGKSVLHQGIGGSTSVSMSLQRLQRYRRRGCPVNGFTYSIKNSPLSGTEYTCLLTDLSQRQLVQKKVAIPPADMPVMITLSALQSPNIQFMDSSCSIELFVPLKYRSIPLQGMGCQRVPICSLPSQQRTQTLDQSQKGGLTLGSPDSMPLLVEFRVAGYLAELPRLDLLLWQQLSRVSAVVAPVHNPPPSKKTTNLFLFQPSPNAQQKAAGEPSRHLAPLSVVCLTRVKMEEADTTAEMSMTEVRILGSIYYQYYELGNIVVNIKHQSLQGIL